MNFEIAIYQSLFGYVSRLVIVKLRHRPQRIYHIVQTPQSFVRRSFDEVPALVVYLLVGSRGVIVKPVFTMRISVAASYGEQRRHFGHKFENIGCSRDSRHTEKSLIAPFVQWISFVFGMNEPKGMQDDLTASGDSSFQVVFQMRPLLFFSDWQGHEAKCKIKTFLVRVVV